jgi:ATP-dependent Clp protease ATP-binding subunit ClpB
LKRAIQRLIQNPLAMQILEGKFVEGDRIVVTPGEGGQLHFEKADANPAPVDA